MATSAQELEAVLQALLVPDNVTIKSAEGRLKELSKSPQFILAIVERAGASTSPQASIYSLLQARRGERCWYSWSTV